MNIKSRESLQNYVNSGNKVKYIFFWGHQQSGTSVTKSCFSQWFESPFVESGISFLTAEHYMMYHKAILFNDAETAEQVLAATNPGEAKALGRKVLGFSEELWQEHRFETVVNANLAKFSQNEALTEFLLNTADRVLVEASPVDKIWGIGLAEDNPDCENPNKWCGLNLLGFALMEVRDRLRNQSV